MKRGCCCYCHRLEQLQGSSAAEKIMQEFRGKPVCAFVVWEPVVSTDWSSPSTVALSRLSNVPGHSVLG
jgi:hypothetical protein